MDYSKNAKENINYYNFIYYSLCFINDDINAALPTKSTLSSQ